MSDSTEYLMITTYTRSGKYKDYRVPPPWLQKNYRAIENKNVVENRKKELNI